MKENVVLCKKCAEKLGEELEKAREIRLDRCDHCEYLSRCYVFKAYER